MADGRQAPTDTLCWAITPTGQMVLEELDECRRPSWSHTINPWLRLTRDERRALAIYVKPNRVGPVSTRKGTREHRTMIQLALLGYVKEYPEGTKTHWNLTPSGLRVLEQRERAERRR